MTSIVFCGKVRAFETPLVETTELTSPIAGRRVPVRRAASSLPPPVHVPINVVDDVAGTFTFPRMQLFVRK